ncbi:MAG: ATP-binding protein, partial [Actinomycetota bacterium]|nr:ATP-binding protein [Actinomycetota bacterium]
MTGYLTYALAEEHVNDLRSSAEKGRVRRVSSPTFVGRAEQLAAFDESLAGAAAGKPSLLLVSGESGVGKSRLVAEFASRTRAAGARV